ncbi:hypothetical protein SUNI508_09396 [Seiridium unicorne]|uniref:Uncharacterized protein n=1 Tax=Seiridium unicorne TaxID=138068 RepID=A0ABR2URG0_9PEZI
MEVVHNNLGSNLINGCCHEAERAERVAQCLEGLRLALSEKLHPHLSGLIEEIYNTCRNLRDLTDQSQVYMARVSVVTEYLNVILPCLARTLIDIDAYYSDRTQSRERRWKLMYHEMTNELPGTTLPARFIMYNQFLNLLRLLLTKYAHPSIHFLANFQLSPKQITELRFECTRVSPKSYPSIEGSKEHTSTESHRTAIHHVARFVGLLGRRDADDPQNSHWAESIFTRPLPSRTKLEKPKNSISQAFGPFERLGQPAISPDVKILVKRSFNNDRLSVTFFLQSHDEAPFVLIRTVQNGQPWVCLHGAHELCISRHDSATLNFTRWSRTDSRSKLWASLKFITWEEMVLFYCTFVCLKTRSIRLVDVHPMEYLLRKEEKLFQASINDDGYTHSLAVYQDSYTGRHRLHATVCEHEMRGCPVWTTFLPPVSSKSRPSWLSRKSRHRVWVHDTQPYVFCDTYRANSQRKGRFGAYELFFVNDQAAGRFMEVFDLGSSVGAIESDKATAGKK